MQSKLLLVLAISREAVISVKVDLRVSFVEPLPLNGSYQHCHG